MDHSVLGKPSLRVGLVMGLIIGLSVLLILAACDDQDSAKGEAGHQHNKSPSSGTAPRDGQAGQEHNKSTSGGTAPTDGLIVFVRYLDQDQTKGAIFTMYPTGSHIRQITHPPKGWSDSYPEWSPDGTKVAFNRQAIDESTSRIMVLNTKTDSFETFVVASQKTPSRHFGE